MPHNFALLQLMAMITTPPPAPPAVDVVMKNLSSLSDEELMSYMTSYMEARKANKAKNTALIEELEAQKIELEAQRHAVSQAVGVIRQQIEVNTRACAKLQSDFAAIEEA